MNERQNEIKIRQSIVQGNMRGVRDDRGAARQRRQGYVPVGRRRQHRRRGLQYFLMLVSWALAAFFMGRAVGKAECYGGTADYRLRQYTAAHGGQDKLTDIEENAENALILVNKEHPLPEKYEVKLVKLPDRVHQGAEQAYEPLCEMLRAGRKEGLAFEICSAYRDRKRQSELFEEDVEALMARGFSYEQAYEEVAKETMPPGCSEHSTGLAFDIVALDYQLLDAGQECTEENIWLREHCAEYGFILRYPKDKEDITQISYESWHFRYVGKEAAKEITERNLTLEEYLEGQEDIL